jgi:hypothetical protein
MLLALNCGFGIAELNSLQCSDLVAQDRIRKIRFKNHVYGEWYLWAETRRMLAWYREQRPASHETAFLLSKTGKPIGARSAQGNRSMRIANAWQLLLRRSGVRPLSFNKLRKTAADLVRQHSDGEIAGVFLCHGQAVRSDNLADRYTNRPFGKLDIALKQIECVLGPIFSGTLAPLGTTPGNKESSVSAAAIATA